MPAERLETRRVREILRYRAEQGLGYKSIAVRFGAAPSTVRETLRHAATVGPSWPLDEDVSDAVPEAALYNDVAGAPGFEPGMAVPKTTALPLGYAPACGKVTTLLPEATPQ